MIRSKLRAGGVLTRDLRTQVLEGDVRAMRALVRQAAGPNTLTMPVDPASVRMVANGTGGDRIVFEGAFTVLEAPYPMWDWAGDYTEVMRAGSLTRTLNAGADVSFVLNHDWNAAPMARTVAGSLDLTPEGLCVARMDASRADCNIVRSAVEGGELNAMSFAFWVTEQMWSPDFTQRDIHEVDMDHGDVSVVTHPANPATTGSTALRSAAREGIMRSGLVPLLIERADLERRAGATLSAATMETLQAVLDLISDADDAVDAAQPLLADLMGVANPDEDDTDTDGDSATADTDTDGEAVSSAVTPEIVRARLALKARARA